MKKKEFFVEWEISIFKIPPCEDIIIIGKDAPIGKNSAFKMLETIAPGMFETIEVKHPSVEALIVKKSLIKFIGKNLLTEIVLKEIETIMDESIIFNISLNIKLMDNSVIKLKNDGS